MTYRIQGILKLPDGAPAANCEIEFVSRKNFSPLVQGAKTNILTSATGAYDVTLEFGEYAVILYTGGTYPAQAGIISVLADTTTGLDLPTLLGRGEWQPATPDYIKQIEAWLVSAGQYATASASSATASAASAASAKESADAALGVVSGQTLPFPDVWLPFSDNLRMLAGYGDEIKVGDYTVASQATFSRATTATYVDKDGALKTAAINEPRFEIGGLLVEQQSANITTRSVGWAASAGATGGNAWIHSGADELGWVTVSGSTNAGFSEGSYIDFAGSSSGIQGSTSTMSIDVKKSTGINVAIRSFNTEAVDGIGTLTCEIKDGQPLPSDHKFSIADMGGWYRVIMTRTFGETGNTIFRLYPFGVAPGAAGALTYRRIQVEKLPSATSYIPTNGAAATRAADIVTIPKSLNNCAEFYSGADAAIVPVGADKLTISPPTGKLNVRNFRGFFTPLTAAQKAALK